MTSGGDVGSGPRAAGRRPFFLAALLLLVLTLLVGGSWLLGLMSPSDALVVYCAHDSLYADQILRDFRHATGIPVQVRFDTEATKSLGLVQLLLRERDHPRCDVFWNNQLQGTLDLQDQGLLLPYKGSGFRRIPDRYKDADGHWVGFAGRLRVTIVNTQRMSATADAVARATLADPSRGAVANPLFGTTRSHYTVLWNCWGRERLIAWHDDVRRRGWQEASGNAMVKNLVANGVCDFGWTDSDDFYVALDDGAPVAILPIRLEDGATICIPNTVAIIRGTRRSSDAQRLVNYLLSAETELALARSKSRQIPLGPVDNDQLPAEVRQLRDWASDAGDLKSMRESRQPCLDWLRSEYLK